MGLESSKGEKGDGILRPQQPWMLMFLVLNILSEEPSKGIVHGGWGPFRLS
jgi:hypothetical protein